MKYRITDLMDLYEDKNCPLTPLDKNMQTIKEVKEILEVKASKHAFDWKQGLSVAAAAVLVAGLGIGGFYLLSNRNSATPSEASAPSDKVTITSYSPPASGDEPAPETTASADSPWQDWESTLQELELDLPRDYYTFVDAAWMNSKLPEFIELFDSEVFLPFFSNGQTRIWQEGMLILKMDLDTRETEALFTLESFNDPYTELVGVTANRLYFDAQVNPESSLYNCYSVNYQNQDRIDLANGVWGSFEEGWILLSDLSIDHKDGGIIKAISPKDTAITPEPPAGPYGGHLGIHDGSFYSIFKNSDCIYSVVQYDHDGVRKDIGSFQIPETATAFDIRIDRINWLVWPGGKYSPLDLSTLQPVSASYPAEELAFDSLDPTGEIVSGVQFYSLKAGFALCTDLGLFVYDDSGVLLFSVDFAKLFDLNGERAVLAGSNHGIACGISDPDSGPQQIVLRYTESPDAAPVYRMISVAGQVWHDPAELSSLLEEYTPEGIEESFSFQPDKDDAAGADGDTLSTVWFIVTNGDGNRIYPFR